MNSDKIITIKPSMLDDIELPAVLYKYRSWGNDLHKRFITHREVFLSSPKSFEDNLDCASPTRFDLLTKEDIYNYFMWSSKNDNPHFTRQQHRSFAREWAKKSDVNNQHIVEEFMKKSVLDYFEHEGILSLTEDCQNLKMWEEYGDNNRGFCIGYSTRILFNYLGGGGRVHYCDELPIIMPEPFMNFAEAMINRVYKKLKKYEFEKEYRTKKFFPYPATIEDRQIKLPKNAFTKIIIGNSMSLENKLELTKAIYENIGDVEIIEL